ncbi:hypothetical protein [Pedobacter agri]|uniref:hypothetical protein n=1 Tax=Pedobacter agri TaxID=454586 RepID=UPI00292FF138|nr:hypothetical protein [Pedobacter agri]
MKELEEIKDQVAIDRGFKNWHNKMEHENKGLFELEVLDRFTDVVAETYAEQFKPKWISVKKSLPEDHTDLVINNEIETTSMVLIMTDTGTVMSNNRVKMVVGDEKWDWVMSMADEEIIFWTPFPGSLKKFP